MSAVGQILTQQHRPTHPLSFGVLLRVSAARPRGGSEAPTDTPDCTHTHNTQTHKYACWVLLYPLIAAPLPESHSSHVHNDPCCYEIINPAVAPILCPWKCCLNTTTICQYSYGSKIHMAQMIWTNNNVFSMAGHVQRPRLATEADGHSQSDLRAAGRRYFSAPAVRRERSKQLKRLRLAAEDAGAGCSVVAAVLGLGRSSAATVVLLLTRAC